jgi:hypothetical protein
MPRGRPTTFGGQILGPQPQAQPTPITPNFFNDFGLANLFGIPTQQQQLPKKKLTKGTPGPDIVGLR